MKLTQNWPLNDQKRGEQGQQDDGSHKERKRKKERERERDGERGKQENELRHAFKKRVMSQTDETKPVQIKTMRRAGASGWQGQNDAVLYNKVSSRRTKKKMAQRKGKTNQK